MSFVRNRLFREQILVSMIKIRIPPHIFHEIRDTLDLIFGILRILENNIKVEVLQTEIDNKEELLLLIFFIIQIHAPG